MTELRCPRGGIRIEPTADGRRRVTAVATDSDQYVPQNGWITTYPEDLIARLFAIKGPNWTCDEIMREEDPAYTASDLRYAILGYAPESDFRGARVLDFGCGAGASTIAFARMAPDVGEVVGVDLDERFLDVARCRAEHYGFANLRFLRSPDPESLPPDLGTFDFVTMNAVYEHLLPHEREPLLSLVWTALRPGGILFVNQTPHRYFPVECHSTGLPLVNYLPDRLCAIAARRFSRRVYDGHWATMLRDGIRGATAGEIVRIPRRTSHRPELLQPSRFASRNRNEIWFEAAAARMGKGKKRWAFAALRAINRLPEIALTPYIELAIRKTP